MKTGKETIRLPDEQKMNVPDKKNGSVVRDFNTLNCFPIIKGKQCIYLLDWETRNITYVRGAKEMLGYDTSEFTKDLIFDIIHPDDAVFVLRIVKGTVKKALDVIYEDESNYAMLTYRVKKKDGTYIRILRQSAPWNLADDGKMKSNFSIFTDISFMNHLNVNWDVHINGMNAAVFKKSIYKEFTGFFTRRELEIIKCIADECTNEEIAKRLFISFHTVKTHRKRIFKKVNCHTKAELLEFCKKNGIL